MHIGMLKAMEIPMPPYEIPQLSTRYCVYLRGTNGKSLGGSSLNVCMKQP